MSAVCELKPTSLFSSPQSLIEEMEKDPTEVYSRILKKYRSIWECQCDTFDRGTVPARILLERSFTKEIALKCPDKNSPIRLCSLGSGGCFEELVLICLLLKAGYTNIQFKLIDPFYKNDIKTILDLCDILFEELDAATKVSIDTECDFDAYLDEIERNEQLIPGAIFLIDIQGVLVNDGAETLLSNALRKIANHPKIPLETLCSFVNKINSNRVSACVSKKNLLNGKYQEVESKIVGNIGDQEIQISNSLLS
jgi:hypothetical protein